MFRNVNDSVEDFSKTNESDIWVDAISTSHVISEWTQPSRSDSFTRQVLPDLPRTSSPIPNSDENVIDEDMAYCAWHKCLQTPPKKYKIRGNWYDSTGIVNGHLQTIQMEDQEQDQEDEQQQQKQPPLQEQLIQIAQNETYLKLNQKFFKMLLHEPSFWLNTDINDNKIQNVNQSHITSKDKLNAIKELFDL